MCVCVRVGFAGFLSRHSLPKAGPTYLGKNIQKTMYDNRSLVSARLGEIRASRFRALHAKGVCIDAQDATRPDWTKTGGCLRTDGTHRRRRRRRRTRCPRVKTVVCQDNPCKQWGSVAYD